MKWYERLIKTKARKFLLIGILMASGVGAPMAVGVGTALDQTAGEILGEEQAGE